MALLRALLLLFVAFFAQGAGAREVSFDALPDGGHGMVAKVMDGDSVRLDHGEKDVRLLGLQAPKLPKGRPHFTPWPLGDAARAALEKLVKGHTVTLRLGVTPEDRNGRILAHLVRDDGLWINEELLREGFARVYTFPDNRQFAAALYKAESEARAAHRGIWANADYAVRSPDPKKLKGDLGTFQIVEGRVTTVAKIKGRVYLNFGADFMTDFTATIPPDAVTLFTKAKVDPLSFKGQVIRVRGYLRDYHGPEIEVSHPEQIESGIEK